jgi:hypothetical protein
MFVLKPRKWYGFAMYLVFGSLGLLGNRAAAWDNSTSNGAIWCQLLRA